jgi:2-iminoacetate synthase ThiH
VADAGFALGQTALRFGADDMGSIMIEENVVSAAGANTEATEKELRYQIAKPVSFRTARYLYNIYRPRKFDELTRENQCR